MKLPEKLRICLLLHLFPAAGSAAVVGGDSYGLDVSFPIHQRIITDSNNNVLGDRQTLYLKHLEGCRQAYDALNCDMFEYDRLLMNQRQPQSMKNYTETGMCESHSDVDSGHESRELFLVSHFCFSVH